MVSAQSICTFVFAYEKIRFSHGTAHFMLFSIFSGEKPYQFYVGVDWQINEVTSLTNQLMLRFLGEPRENVTEDNCKAPKGNNVSDRQTNTFIEALVINNIRASDIIRASPCILDPLLPHLYMSRVRRKPAFCTCENKDADQLRGNREADQRLCFRYTDSTIPLLPKSEISRL